MAATRSLSQSEPDIPSHYNETAQPYGVEDDDVIGFSERLGDSKDVVDHHKPSPKPLEEKQPKPVEKPKETVPAKLVPQKQQPVVVDDFPSLPGTKTYLPQKNAAKKIEDFPALPMAAATVKTKATRSGWDKQKKEITHVNGVVVKSVKPRKKGKAKQIKQPDAADFPALGQQEDFPKFTPPPSKFNNFIEETSSKKKENKYIKEVKTPAASVDKPINDVVAPVVNKAKKVERTPPGFTPVQEKPQSSGPPGFSGKNVQKNRAPPPGLQTQQISNTTKERNMRLLEMLQRSLDESNLNTFKDLSGKYRRELITGDVYYQGISKLLGDNLKYLFSELVALLPDEEKQAELLGLHNDAKIRSKQLKEDSRTTPKAVADYSKPQKWGNSGREAEPEPVLESRCEKCGITLLIDKIQEHLESHGEAFPALPVTTKKKKNYSFNSSARVSRQQPLSVRSAWGK